MRAPRQAGVSSGLNFDWSTFRRVFSPELGRLCDALADGKSMPEQMDIYSPRQAGPPGLCEEIIPTNELLLNRELIDPLWLARKGTQRALRKHVPSLDEDLSMRACSVDPRITARDGAHFLKLILANEEGEKGGLKHADERADLWRALEITRGLEPGSLSWRVYNPSILLVYIPPRVASDETAKTLGKAIQGALPLPVTLKAAEFPTL